MKIEQTLDLDAIRAQFKRAKEIVSPLVFGKRYEVNDYPIGSNNRGICRLEYDINQKKGEYRTVRTTTDKNGRWCTPKKSTYREFLAVAVVSGHLPLANRDAAWLSASRNGGVCLTYPNYDHELLVYPPVSYGGVRRKDSTYTVTSRNLAGEVVDSKDHVMKADRPELIAAYDEYIVELCSFVRFLNDNGADTVMPLDQLVSAMFKSIGRQPVAV